MLDSAKKIKRYTKDYDYETFTSDDKTMDAVVRNFEIIKSLEKLPIGLVLNLETLILKLNGKEYEASEIE